MTATVALTVDGRAVEVGGGDMSLLDALREELGLRSVKDGCSPQGQCGCCTVLVDGAPRVACVTPLRRVAGRAVTTVDGLDPQVRDRLVDAFVAGGASQCGFCTPGIVVRLAALGPDPTPTQVESALLAHLCRCTGWRTIVDAATAPGEPESGAGPAARPRGKAGPVRHEADAMRRALLEGGVPQRVGPAVVLGRGGFADDAAPAGCLVAVADGRGGWAVGETLSEAQAQVDRVQGRRSGQQLCYPVARPEGDWAVTLETTWVEPAYLEPDASWCLPGGEPASAVGNGGAFGAKSPSVVTRAARELADRYGRAVRVRLAREDAVRLGGKRPPVAAGVRADGTGVIRVVRTAGIAAAIRSAAPGLSVEEVDVIGLPTSAALRGAGWAEAAVLLAAVHAVVMGGAAAPAWARPPRVGAVGAPVEVRLPPAAAVVASPAGARAEATVTMGADGLPTVVHVALSCGDPLDEVVLRSYAVGAAHMALGWVCSEGIAVDGHGHPEDLTIRSFGVLRARDTPPITVELVERSGPAVNGSDAVFAAVAAATWIAQGLPPRWPTSRGRFR